MTESSQSATAGFAQTSIAAAARAMKQGDMAEAAETLKNLLAAEPSHELANGMLGSVYAELGMTDRAVACFQRALTTNPGNPLARFQMGTVLLTANRHQDAINALEQMLNDSQDFLAHYHSGVALLSLQRTAEARTLLARARQRMPTEHVLSATLDQLLASLT